MYGILTVDWRICDSIKRWTCSISNSKFPEIWPERKLYYSGPFCWTKVKLIITPSIPFTASTRNLGSRFGRCNMCEHQSQIQINRIRQKKVNIFYQISIGTPHISTKRDNFALIRFINFQLTSRCLCDRWFDRWLRIVAYDWIKCQRFSWSAG